ncbi:DUF2690 domain-containing protein [Kitasatospora sp. NPDC058218]|uniref:DUF2690 domain-containing protein n=1 Tax=Kitasatospora sp. NPDC058218 TaxID=3346385 RepID=UPI0036DF2E9B
MARRSAVLIAGLLTFGATTLVTPMDPVASAVVARHCTSDACTGKNPKVEGCDTDAETLTTVRATSGGPTVELRRSRTCSAAWIRFSTTATDDWKAKLDIQGHDPYVINASPSYPAYSPMVGTSKSYRACVKEYMDAHDRWACTPKWY